jgi:RNA binding exosome subunit
MGLYKGQNIIAGSYMLPRADDNIKVNVSRKKINKRKKKMKEERKKHSKK